MDALKTSPKLKQTVILLFVLGASICAVAAQPQPQPLRLEKSADAMGSTYTIDLYGPDRIVMEDAADAAFDEVRRIDELLSNYKPDSELSKVNRLAAQGPMKISPELFDLLSRCLEYSRQSEGAFDITVGPLMKVWGFFKGSGRLPHRAVVQAALDRLSAELGVPVTAIECAVGDFTSVARGKSVGHQDFVAMAGSADIVPLGTQQLAQHIEHVGIVIDHEEIGAQ